MSGNQEYCFSIRNVRHCLYLRKEIVFLNQHFTKCLKQSMISDISAVADDEDDGQYSFKSFSIFNSHGSD